MFRPPKWPARSADERGKRTESPAISKNLMMAMGREYWEIHLPRRYRRLLEAGQLEPALASAAEMTLQAMQSLQAGGISRWEAWQTVGSRHLILPAEIHARPLASRGRHRRALHAHQQSAERSR